MEGGDKNQNMLLLFFNETIEINKCLIVFLVYYVHQSQLLLYHMFEIFDFVAAILNVFSIKKLKMKAKISCIFNDSFFVITVFP